MSQPKNTEKKRILAVDDEPDVIEVIQEQLEDYTVVPATSFEAAHKLILAEHFDLAILDIMGVNGFALLDICAVRRLPAAMLTAHALNIASINLAIKLEDVSFLPKDELARILPVLESLLKRAMEDRHSAQTVESDLNGLAQKIYLTGGMRLNSGDVARQRAEMEAHLKRVRESIAEIDAIGVQVKDLDTGQLDFPCRLEDRVVLLCWRVGEPAIEHWHTPETGFKDRQPVDERFRRHTSPGSLPNSALPPGACRKCFRLMRRQATKQFRPLDSFGSDLCL